MTAIALFADRIVLSAAKKLTRRRLFRRAGKDRVGMGQLHRVQCQWRQGGAM